MANVFRYTDYRRFLADYYAEHKKANHGFSYQVLCEQAGFRNKGFLHNVITGNKNLSSRSVASLAAALKLSDAESRCFATLVAFNQARTLDERNQHFEQLDAIRTSRAGIRRVRETRRDQYEYYAHWYYAAVRGLLDILNFRGNWVRLARSLHPRTSPSQARAAVELLMRLGLATRKAGRYVVADKLISAGPEVLALGLQKFQQEVADLSRRAVAELPADRRHASGVTLGISLKTYQRICAELDSLRAKALAMAEQDKKADNVYQLSLNLFPVSDVQGTLRGRSAKRGGRAAGTSTRKGR